MIYDVRPNFCVRYYVSELLRNLITLISMLHNVPILKKVQVRALDMNIAFIHRGAPSARPNLRPLRDVV